MYAGAFLSGFKPNACRILIQDGDRARHANGSTYVGQWKDRSEKKKQGVDGVSRNAIPLQFI